MFAADLVRGCIADEFGRDGFCVLRGAISQSDWQLLRERCLDNLCSYEATPELSDKSGGIQSMHLPLLGWGDRWLDAAAEAPTVEQAAALLTGRHVFCDPLTVEAVSYRSSVPWHRDATVDTLGVKFVAYLDGLTGENALLMAAGSHRSLVPSESEILALHTISVVEVDAGDVIAFDLRSWHANFGVGPRTQWTITFLAAPDTAAERAAAEHWLREGESYDAAPTGIDRSWVNPNWFASASSDSVRERWVAQMADLGRVAASATRVRP